ncbi:unnamed protein product [Sympodiomycopsis kandeliae]
MRRSRASTTARPEVSSKCRKGLKRQHTVRKQLSTMSDARQNESSEKVLEKKVKSSVQTKQKKKNKLIRPRGKRGGVKNRKPVAAQSGKDDTKKSAQSVKGNKSKTSNETAATVSSAKTPDEVESTATPHSIRIARYHALEREYHSPATTSARQEEILAEQESMGGIDAYQNDSSFGADKQRGGESGKWLATTLDTVLETKKPEMKLLDVGALTGTSYSSYPWLKTTSIDINPRSENVLKSDFFDFPIPDSKFDVVCLSLVLNFVGDLKKRGEALLHAHQYLTPKGYLYLVLPLACVNSSRYLDHERLTQILDSTGWKVVVQDDSNRLTRWLCQRKSKSEWDGTVYTKKEIRKAIKANNFCIRLG